MENDPSLEVIETREFTTDGQVMRLIHTMPKKPKIKSVRVYKRINWEIKKNYCFLYPWDESNLHLKVGINAHFFWIDLYLDIVPQWYQIV